MGIWCRKDNAFKNIANELSNSLDVLNGMEMETRYSNPITLDVTAVENERYGLTRTMLSLCFQKPVSLVIVEHRTYIIHLVSYSHSIPMFTW